MDLARRGSRNASFDLSAIIDEMQEDRDREQVVHPGLLFRKPLFGKSARSSVMAVPCKTIMDVLH